MRACRCHRLCLPEYPEGVYGGRRYDDGMTGTIPTLEQIDAVHRKVAPSQAAYDLIHTHCVIVADITRRLAHRQNALFMRRCTLTDVHAEQVDVPPTDGVAGGLVPPRYIDVDTAVRGAMVHDIGTYLVLRENGANGGPLKFGDNYIEHGLLGYRLLLDEGIDESIAQFARNHTGVGLTKEAVARQHLPLPPDDYVPLNLEQEIVMVADKYNSKSVPPRFLTSATYARKAARFGEANRDEWLELVRKYGEPPVAALAEHYHQKLT
ncbi:phosphohydrolase [Bifidobacterium anseris]|uniref:Phosphohydrolase n=2 Tax=Bifidobacterium TaxID=1678 RepID=A0A2N5J010_9BIFI|nr:phosphohydrolase [Bifidobacterium anseris]